MSDKLINKVVYGDEVLIDISQDTITAADLKKNVTAHISSGASITGTAAMVYYASNEELKVPGWMVEEADG